jgi:GNAT superfamily N-acetyltransferase
MPMRIECRRLAVADAKSYQSLRIEGFRLEPRAFRYAPEDESGVTPADVETRLRRDHVVGAYAGDELIGVGGLAYERGVKTGHKALLYGMYVRPAFRGAGASDAIMNELLDIARSRVEIVTLTVVSQNDRARRFYERWGFRAYGIEERAIKLSDDDYLDETLMAQRLAP